MAWMGCQTTAKFSFDALFPKPVDTCGWRGKMQSQASSLSTLHKGGNQLSKHQHFD